MHRRVFLKVTGTLAVAGAVKALPAATAWRRDAAAVRSTAVELAAIPTGIRLTIHEPGTYRIAGHVRFDDAAVEISGITHTQRITWSGVDDPNRRLTGFAAFEHITAAGETRTIQVRGGRLEGVTAVPIDYA